MNRSFGIFPSHKIIHAFSTRLGGVSPAPFDSLNLGRNTKDDAKNIEKNKKLFFNRLNINKSRCVFPIQVHSDTIVTVNRPGIIDHCDALITKEKNLFLTIQTADCFPVFLYNPLAEVIAIIHSGWRGSALNIVGQTIEKMGGNPDHILAAIAPGIQRSCYQVSKETAANFAAKYSAADNENHFKLDLLAVIYDQLIEKGIKRNNIEIDRDCTHCREDLYYSYRRDGENAGRMMGVIGMIDTAV
jgi:YfiH family protein